MEKYRMDASKGLEFGLYTLGDHIPSPHTGGKECEGYPKTITWHPADMKSSRWSCG